MYVSTMSMLCTVICICFVLFIGRSACLVSYGKRLVCDLRSDVVLQEGDYVC